MTAISRKGDALMEQIIILVVIGLLSTLFSKKNKSDSQNEQQQSPERQQMPQSEPRPTSPQPQVTRQPQPQQAKPVEQMDPFKRLKELTGDIYREIQEDQKKSATETAHRMEPVVVEVPTKQQVTSELAQASRNRARSEGRSSGRLSAHNAQDNHQKNKHISSRVDIRSEQDILKGIIFSEILGPPKSKQ